MLAALVKPIAEGIAPFLLAAVTAGVGPPISDGAVEALNLAVGLRTVRARPLRCDRQGLAGIAPQVCAVRAAVVRQHALDGDATVGEPLHRPVKDGGGDGRLVIMNFCVRDTRVVVDDGVHERVPELRTAVLITWLARGDGAILLALAAADVAPAAAVGDVADLLHVQVHERPGVKVLVPSDRLTGRAIDVGQPVQARCREDAMHGGRCDVESGSELNGPFPQSRSQAHAPLHHRLRGLVRRRSWA
ncbi:hypothetical protein JOC45_002438 [Gordonia hydrophobica]|nr:hypothetical protein [Gordonia hydrophobica]